MAQYILVIDPTDNGGKPIMSTTDLGTIGAGVNWNVVLFDNSGNPIIDDAGNLVTL